MTMTASRESTSTHPKIRERREAVEDQKLRSRNRKLLFAAIVVLLALLAAASTQSPLLDVDEVRVIGASRTSADAVREAAAISTGQPLLGLDLGSAQDRLLQVPEIAAATARSRYGTRSTTAAPWENPPKKSSSTSRVCGASR